MQKKILYIDMDNVIVDFQSGIDLLSEQEKISYQGKYDEVPNIFSLMKPIEGAIEAIEKLNERYDIYLLSTAPWHNPSAWSDKVMWVQKYLGEVCYKKLIITHHKNLNNGDFLIDDREKNGAKDFGGELLLFGSNKFPNWEAVLKYLLHEIENMDELRQQVDNLLSCSDKDKQVAILQKINKLFLSKYMLEIDQDFILYPIEVEAYYYNESNFPDTCVHKFKWQKNRYGKLYFHRSRDSDDAFFLFDGGGFDVCLSYSDNFYLGVLIRGAHIIDKSKVDCIDSPGNLAKRVIQYICHDDSLVKIDQGSKEAVEIEKLEDRDDVLKLAKEDPRDKESLLFNSTRFGIELKNHPVFADYRLRSLIEFQNHSFKAKEKVVFDYMVDRKEGQSFDNNDEQILDRIKELLGYKSNTILKDLKKEND